MRISELLAERARSGGPPVFSFEFFPPKTEAGERNLKEALAALVPLAPGFVSVTYGAGGGTRERTLAIVSQIKREHGLEAMAHLTCVGASVEQLRAVLDEMEHAGIENVLALRGDPPHGEGRFAALPGGLAHASELVALVRSHYSFTVGAACFPETHIDAKSPEEDIAHLAEKVAAGAEFLITQLFFDNAAYFDFLGRARAAGITVPIIPGVMPITQVGQVERMAALCGARIPAELQSELHARRDQQEAVLDLGVAYATLQCAELLAAGAPGIHFYTLNRSPATRAILSALKLARPWQRAQRAEQTPAGQRARGDRALA
jgi:methylenetetrahydrofolate reductase (NADPH)